jgi:prepilin-type N-terminal cleavage/methylation domain-containing protein
MAPMMTSQTTISRRADRAGFTLVELLVVLFIIALLAALLLPAVSAVRQNSKVASTKHLLSSLEIACGGYKEDLQGFPPSSVAIGSLVPADQDNDMETWQGAELLALHLVGALTGIYDGNGSVAGTPDADHTMGRGILFRRGGRESVHGPYVDLARSELSTTIFVDIAVNDESGTFPPSPARFPPFLDDFGGVIAYHRAGSIQNMAVGDADDASPLGVYRYEDNAAVYATSPGANGVCNNDPFVDDGPARSYFPPDTEPAGLPPGDDIPDCTSDAADPDERRKARNRFLTYIVNPSTDPDQDLTGTWTDNATFQNRRNLASPHNRDSFLLVSAGPDGIFGSEDDIANFPFNPLIVP